MSLPQSDNLSSLKSQHSLSYFQFRLPELRRNGNGFITHCKLHHDKTPSLSIFESGSEWRFKCFGCSTSGDVLSFIQRLDSTTFPEAKATFVAFCAGSPVENSIKATAKPSRPRTTHAQLDSFSSNLREQLDDPFSPVSEYLSRRGIQPQIAVELRWGIATKRFRHTSDPNEAAQCKHCQTDSLAIVIPRFQFGELVGVKYRNLDPPDPQHKWSQESGSGKVDLLYGPSQAVDVLSSMVFIAEGEHEAALLASLGFNAKAILGTSGVPTILTPDFEKELGFIAENYKNAVLIADAGDAGFAAMERLKKWFGDFPSQIVSAPGHKDFGDFFQADKAATAWLRDLERNPVAIEAPPSISGQTDSKYPIEVWDDTAYGEFARRCGRRNHIAREYFVEALKTLTGAVVGKQIRIANMSHEPRFYTVNIGDAGSGKSSAVSWALGVFPEDLIYSSDRPVHNNIGVYKAEFGSGSGLVQTFCDHPRVLIHADELEAMIEKFSIGGSGASFLSGVNTLFESARPPSNITRNSRQRPTEAHLSILANTPPDRWDGMFAKTGAVGSGFFQRLNIVSSENTETVAVLYDPDLNGFQEQFVEKIRLLESKPVEAILDLGAERALADWQEWLKKQPDESEVQGRLQVLILRNAMHLAWLLNRPFSGDFSVTNPDINRVTIDADIIERSIKLAKCELEIRRQKRPLIGENPSAQLENAICRELKRSKSMGRSDLYRKVHGDRQGLRIFNGVVESLLTHGAVDAKPLPTKGRRSQMLVWVGE